MKKIFSQIMALAIAVTFTSTSIFAAELEEIIVTAQKKEQNLQEVAVSVTVISGEKIANAALHSLTQLSTYIPNFSVSENAITTIASMRGIGPGANQSFEQSVGLFVDGIHLAKGRQYRTGLFDVERVEVLRGPQGVLFGKNTLAGAINVVSAKANVGEEFGGSISIAGEGNGGELIEGNVHGTIAKNFALRLSFKDRQEDGWIDDLYNGTTGPMTDETMFRLSGTWQPSEDFSLSFRHTDGDNIRTGSTVIVNHWEPLFPLTATAGLAYFLVGYAPLAAANPFAPFGLPANGFFPEVYNIASSGQMVSYKDMNYGPTPGSINLGINPEGTHTETQDTSVTMSYEMGNGLTLTSITGRAEYTYVDGIDADFLPVTLVSRDDWSSYTQDSQEFRIASDTDSDFSWLAGVYWDSQEQDIERLIDLDGTLGGIYPLGTILQLSAAQAGYFGVPFGIEGLTSFSHTTRIGYWNQQTRSKEAYFQGTYQASDKLSVIFGGRYSDETKHILAGTDLGTYHAGDRSTIQTANPNPFLAAILGSLFDTYAHHFTNEPERNTSHFIPSLVLERTIDDDNMIYFSFTKGFKSGGFNAADDQNPEFEIVNGAPTPMPNVPGIGFEYDDETATSYEIGGKHTLANGALRFNWAYADAEYKNQQVSTFVGLGFIVGNAASSVVKTLEVDLLWQATDSLRLGVNAAYLDAMYDSFPAAACNAIQAAGMRALGWAGGAPMSTSPVTNVMGCQARFNAAGLYHSSVQDLSGKTGTGKYNGSLIADYTKEVGSAGMQFFFSVDYNFFDDYLYTGDLDPLDHQEASERVNVQTGVRTDKWQMTVYGRNITDNDIANGGFDVPLADGAHAIYFGESEVWGARFTYNF